MKKLILILASLMLVGCETAEHRRAYHVEKDDDFDVQQKLSNKLNEYSSAVFNYSAFYGGDAINSQTVTKVGQRKLGKFRYMSASIYFANIHQKKYFDEKKYISQGRVYYGYSSLNQEDANKKSLEYCKIIHQRLVAFYESRNVKPMITECEIIVTYDFVKLIENNTIKETTTPVRNTENEYERYLKQCEQIGFKRNTEKIGECALKIKDIEAKIQISNSQTIASQSSQQQNTQTTQNQNSSADTLANLVILNESLKLMNPPKRNFNCQARPFGIYTNVYCN